MKQLMRNIASLMLSVIMFISITFGQSVTMKPAKTTEIDSGIFLGTQGSTGTLYWIASEGRMYGMTPKNRTNPLGKIKEGTSVMFRLDIQNNRIYVIVPSEKYGLSKEYRYDLVQIKVAN
jgi:hypothetical protein